MANLIVMRRVLLAAVVIAVSLLVSPAKAAEPDRAASSFRSLTIPVTAGDDILMTCVADSLPAGSSYALLAMLATTRADGSMETRRSSLYRNWDGAGVQASYDGQRVDAELLPGSLTVLATGAHYAAGVSTATTLRAIAAGWGAEWECELTRNGVAVSGWTDQPGSRAVYAMSHDFEDGVAATAPICVAGTLCQGAAAGAGLTYTRSSDGFVFSYFDPGTLGVWTGTVAPPNQPPTTRGPVCTNGFNVPPSCPVIHAVAADGDWTYTVDAQVTDRGAPLLFFVDVPL